jgi:putative DNA primase/helicase
MTLYSPTRAQLAAIPAQLKARRQFVLWRGRDRANHPGKLDKIPMNPYDLEHASTTDALTWGTFDQCAEALETALEGWHAADPTGYRGGGIGYVFTTDDPYVGIDLDGCVNDATWVIEAWAQVYVDTLRSYTEVTPSQTGLHILAEGSLPPGGRRKGAVEMYSEGRFFTLTGWHLDGTPETIEPRHTPLEEVWAQLFGPKGDQPTEDTLPTADTPTPSMPDWELFDKLYAAQNAPKFRELMKGHWKELGYPSPSEGDLALCGIVRFYSQDPLQIDRVFRQSGMMRSKWDETRGKSSTYGTGTIHASLAEPHEHYIPPPMLLGIAPQKTITVNGKKAKKGSVEWGTPREPMTFTDTADIWSKAYPMPSWLIEDLIPEGLTYLVGSQKTGKTYFSYSLALTLATSVVTHNLWLDYYPVLMDGPVVYLSLEDTEVRYWKRIHQLMPYLQDFPRDRLFFRYDPLLPSLAEGLADHLYNDILKIYQPSLLIIDPISYVSGFPRDKNSPGDTYTEFRRAMLPVRAMATENHMSVLGLEHRRKKSNEDIDIFETQQGSNAKGAIADASLAIVREDEDLILHSRQRDAKEQTITLTFTFNDQQLVTLTYKGAHEGHLDPGNFSALTMKVMDALSSLQQPMSMPEMLAATSIPDSRQARKAIFQVLYRAIRAGNVQKTNRGMYVWSGGQAANVK